MRVAEKLEISEFLPDPDRRRSAPQLRIDLLTSLFNFPDHFGNINQVLTEYFKLRNSPKHQERTTKAVERIKKALVTADKNNECDKGDGIKEFPYSSLAEVASIMKRSRL